MPFERSLIETKMKHKKKNILKKRIAGASVSSVISISLALMLVGIAASLTLNISSIENYFKENIHITAFLDKGTPVSKAVELQAKLEKEHFVKKTRYVSAKQGTEELIEMLGEDFADVFVTSPIPSSIELLVKAEYFQIDSLDAVLKKIASYPLVESATTQAAMVDSIGETMAKVALGMAILVFLLTFISIVLISNTVRLNIYSARFTIHTMQMVGASRAFISKPFLRRSALMGALSGIMACAIIAGILVFIKVKVFPAVFELFDINMLIKIAVMLVLLGMLVCLCCARAVMGKVIKLDKDELYA